MITKSEMKRLQSHSKKHKGGMNSAHMKNMKKFMKQGDSFITAHNKAVKKDKMKNIKRKKSNMY
jgi:flagellar biosynthesis chaperone FliJ